MRRAIDGTLRLSPTDLANHLACPHLTQPNLRVLRGEFERPVLDDPYGRIITAKGNEHEAAYLARLEAARLTVDRLAHDWRLQVDQQHLFSCPASRTGAAWSASSQRSLMTRNDVLAVAADAVETVGHDRVLAAAAGDMVRFPVADDDCVVARAPV